jgi:hypothetical protein
MKKALLLGLAVVLVCPGSLLALVVLAATGGFGQVTQPCIAGAGPVADLTDERAMNARTIVGVGRDLGVPDQGLVAALAAANQESGLVNLDYGDRDSLGLFQQRPSAGWGTPDELTDPDYTARVFFGGPDGPNDGEPPGLLDIDGWESLPVADAVQAVQRSADGSLYEDDVDDAEQWLADIDGAAAASSEIDSGDSEGCDQAASNLSGEDGDPVVDNIGEIQSRAAAFQRASFLGAPDPFYGQVSYYRLCAQLAARINGHAHSGFATAREQWGHYVTTGVAHPGDSSPPPGALLFYDNSDSAGHVAVYLGDGQVVSNDVLDAENGRTGGVYIVDAAELTDGAWQLDYLGWAPPLY